MVQERHCIGTHSYYLITFTAFDTSYPSGLRPCHNKHFHIPTIVFVHLSLARFYLFSPDTLGYMNIKVMSLLPVLAGLILHLCLLYCFLIQPHTDLQAIVDIEAYTFPSSDWK